MLEAILPLLGKVFDRILPDPVAAADAKLKVMQLVQSGEFEQLHADVALATGQLEVNKIEAANSNTFVSGWRPFIGWVCGAGCAWNWLGLPVALFVCAALGHPLNLTKADVSEMMPLIFGMLGLGGMRTYEKVKGAA